MTAHPHLDPFAALEDVLGPAAVGSKISSIVRTWERDPAGAAVIFARCADKTGSSLVGQVRQLLTEADASGIAVRQVIAAVGGSASVGASTCDYLDALSDAVDESWCKYVVAVDYTRLSRDMRTFLVIWDCLKGVGSEVLVSDATRLRPVDMATDLAPGFSVDALASTNAQIRKRTQQGVIRRLEKGDHGVVGWSVPFGFRRQAGTGEIKAHRAELKTVKAIFEWFGDLAGPVALPEIEQRLAAAGMYLSRARIRALLKRSIYVDGQPTVDYAGVTWPLRTIRLPDPVSIELFDRVQQRLARRPAKP